MKKEALLRLIAESGYNIGDAAKQHLATYDIVEDAGVGVALLSGWGHMRAVRPLVGTKVAGRRVHHHRDRSVEHRAV